MSNMLSRIGVASSGVPSPQEPHPSSHPEPEATGAAGGAFQRFVIQRHLPARYPAPVLSPAQHQAARRRLFEGLVRRTLNDRAHPFSGLDQGLKQDMINSITEELVQSHYKV
jgi:hypothetical protein